VCQSGLRRTTERPDYVTFKIETSIKVVPKSETDPIYTQGPGAVGFEQKAHLGIPQIIPTMYKGGCYLFFITGSNMFCVSCPYGSLFFNFGGFSIPYHFLYLL
jgi:hypothetical protein